MAAGARPRRQRLSGSEALTPRERQVAQLAARGVRNRDIAQRLFITPKTVEWHLGNAYRKLELHSRELAHRRARRVRAARTGRLNSARTHRGPA